MNLQSLSELASVVLLAMKLREESYDSATSQYKLSYSQASDDAVTAIFRSGNAHISLPHVKACSHLVNIMLMSWNDTEEWSRNIERMAAEMLPQPTKGAGNGTK